MEGGLFHGGGASRSSLSSLPSLLEATLVGHYFGTEALCDDGGRSPPVTRGGCGVIQASTHPPLGIHSLTHTSNYYIPDSFLALSCSHSPHTQTSLTPSVVWVLLLPPSLQNTAYSSPSCPTQQQPATAPTQQPLSLSIALALNHPPPPSACVPSP